MRSSLLNNRYNSILRFVEAKQIQLQILTYIKSLKKYLTSKALDNCIHRNIPHDPFYLFASERIHSDSVNPIRERLLANRPTAS